MEKVLDDKFVPELQDICDMKQLFLLLDNWSKSCGMSTMIIDNDGKQISENFGNKEFCDAIQKNEKGIECCRKIWKSDVKGGHECPFGFWEFSIPLTLPNGQTVGKVIAGQALSIHQKDEKIISKVKEIGIDDRQIKEILAQAKRKTNVEMEGSYGFLKETLDFFIQKSYYIWKHCFIGNYWGFC